MIGHVVRFQRSELVVSMPPSTGESAAQDADRNKKTQKLKISAASGSVAIWPFFRLKANHVTVVATVGMYGSENRAYRPRASHALSTIGVHGLCGRDCTRATKHTEKTKLKTPLEAEAGSLWQWKHLYS